MEGLTEGQAARRLGRPVGTIRSQLTRARQRLRGQLIRRGLAPASVVLVVAHAGRPANAAVAAALVSSTVQSAVQFAAMKMTAGIVSASAAAFAEKYLRIMLMTRIKNVVMAALVAIGIATAGAFALEPQAEKGPIGERCQAGNTRPHACLGESPCAIGRRDDGPTAGV